MKGWVSASLATSSLLRAVGVGSSAIPATALAASIKWITKDGVGALGRLFVGGGLGLFIDEDPRLWRMVAEAISTIGLSLEIGTVFFPSQFLLLAGTGNFAKALAKGIANPAFRVMQQHFSRSNNIGEVSAKEESWEVAGQMTGILTSVGILSLLQDADTWQPVLGTWMGFHSVHVVCRYFALKTLQFDSLNLVRAFKAIEQYKSNGEVLIPAEMSKEESFLTDWMTSMPKILFGCSLSLVAELVGGDLEEWAEIFENEKFLLYVADGAGYVVLKQGSDRLDRLKALYLFVHVVSIPALHSIQSRLKEGLVAVDESFEDFKQKLEDAGWDLTSTLFRTGSHRYKYLRS